MYLRPNPGAFGPDPAACRLDNRIRHRQPQSRPLARSLRGIERIKYRLELISGDPLAIIGERLYVAEAKADERADAVVTVIALGLDAP